MSTATSAPPWSDDQTLAAMYHPNELTVQVLDAWLTAPPRDVPRSE